jgi:predicted porin
MNRKLLALAVTAALAAPLAAQAAPTVYGQLNMSLDMVDIDNGSDQFEVNSNASRLGLKGEEALTSGYTAIYKAEFGVAADDGVSTSTWNALLLDSTGTPVSDGFGFYNIDGQSDSVLSSRDIYLGLKANWGTVKLGNYDSPLKSSQGGVDQFNDMTYTDLATVISGDNRMSNLIGYESPVIADAITVKVALQPGEDTGTSDGLADVISASVAYEGNGLYLALAMDQGDGQGVNAGTDRDTIRLTGTYTMDALQLGAMIQTSELSDGAVDNQEQALLLSAAYTMGKNILKGQVISSTVEDMGPEDEETMMFAVGFDHNFTQTTKVYAQAAMAQVDNVGGVSGADGDGNVLTVGMQTKF